ncbi:MAG: ABC transporter ATP-binding protein [Clostridia bacterium]|nr:ABC transporter ATP-binding protein [Clostridia bacterium]
MNRIEISKLNKSFIKDEREMKVLFDISMTVGDNEFVSVVGPSGCGKSTLLRTIAGLISCDEGEIQISGGTSYLQQKTMLMPWRNVYDNVILPLELKSGKKTRDNPEILALLKEFGLEGFENHMTWELSGGMAKRAALARTYLEGREILLLDEPFSSLDAINRKALQKWLLDVWESHRKSVVFVTHEIDEALILSDKVYVLSGRPATVSSELIPGFSRPRDFDIIYSPEFTEKKKHIEKILLENI